VDKVTADNDPQIEVKKGRNILLIRPLFHPI